MSKITFSLLSILFWLILTPVYLFACGCPGLDGDLKKSITDEFQKSALVFSGTVVEAKWVPAAEKNNQARKIKVEILTLKFAVDGWWKGAKRKEIVWRTSDVIFPDYNEGMMGSNCEYRFKLGKTYLVYAEKFEDRFIASVCGRTKTLANAGQNTAELQILGEIGKK